MATVEQARALGIWDGAHVMVIPHNLKLWHDVRVASLRSLGVDVKAITYVEMMEIPAAMAYLKAVEDTAQPIRMRAFLPHSYAKQMEAR